MSERKLTTEELRAWLDRPCPAPQPADAETDTEPAARSCSTCEGWGCSRCRSDAKMEVKHT